jgi:hypothetical protein
MHYYSGTDVRAELAFLKSMGADAAFGLTKIAGDAAQTVSAHVQRCVELHCSHVTGASVVNAD